MSCLEKFALRRSQGKSDFPGGRSPEGKSFSTPGEITHMVTCIENSLKLEVIN